MKKVNCVETHTRRKRNPAASNSRCLRRGAQPGALISGQKLLPFISKIGSNIALIRFELPFLLVVVGAQQLNQARNARFQKNFPCIIKEKSTRRSPERGRDATRRLSADFTTFAGAYAIGFIELRNLCLRDARNFVIRITGSGEALARRNRIGRVRWVGSNRLGGLRD